MRGDGRFLTPRERSELLAIARTRRGDHLAGVRATAILHLDGGRSTAYVAKALFVNADTVRAWRREFRERGLDSIGMAGYSRREGLLSQAQEETLKAAFSERPPRDTVEVRARIAEEFGVEYSRQGACKLMDRLGFAFVKPKHVPKVADEQAQRDFIKLYNRIMNGLRPTESVVFADAVHPEYQSRPAHGWFPKGSKPILKATTGRRRLNIYGAFNLEEMRLSRVEGERVDGETTLRLLKKIEADYPDATRVHVFLDNARYNHAKMLKPWLARPERRVKLHYLPPYCPHLNPIERLWGVMHRHVTHNRHYGNFRQFTEAIFGFFDRTLPNSGESMIDTITDNFRVIGYDDCLVVG